MFLKIYILCIYHQLISKNCKDKLIKQICPHLELWNQLVLLCSNQFSSVTQSCWHLPDHRTAAHQVSLSITNSWSLLKLMSIKLVMPSSRLILYCPLLLLPQSLPASGSFPVSQSFTSGGQSIGVSASASVLPMNIQYCFPLGWTGLISLQSKGLSRVFSNTAVQKHQFFSAQLSSQSSSHIHT